MKSIGLVFFIIGFLDLFCYGQQIDTMIYNNPDVLPTFRYDTCSDLKGAVKRYFTDNYKMPDILIDNGYAGNIYVEFVIEKDSSISNVKLIRGIHEPLDKSVIEIIKEMPKWSPGINKEKVVRTRIILPISIHWLYGKIEE
jgi:Gram-negative bacterial TonB protein C-terminal